MNKKEVKVFNAYAVENEYDNILGKNNVHLFEYHNRPINKDGFVEPSKEFKNKLPKLKPLDKHIVVKDKYVLDDSEKLALSILKHNSKSMYQLYDSAKRKERKYITSLYEQLNQNLFEGEKWDCYLSPFGYCLYTFDEYDEPTCIFCGEPEERK